MALSGSGNQPKPPTTQTVHYATRNNPNGVPETAPNAVDLEELYTKVQRTKKPEVDRSKKPKELEAHDSGYAVPSDALPKRKDPIYDIPHPEGPHAKQILAGIQARSAQKAPPLQQDKEQPTASTPVEDKRNLIQKAAHKLVKSMSENWGKKIYPRAPGVPSKAKGKEGPSL